MARFFKKKFEHKGLAPGTIRFVGEKRMEQARVQVIDYDKEQFTEQELTSIEDITAYISKPTTTWINIDGLHDVELLQRIGEICRLHPLILEDVASTTQRPKLVEYDNCIYVTLKMLHYETGKGKVVTEQLSLVLCRDVLISFQERVGDVFDPVRDRIRNAKGQVRKMGADYLLYALLDTVIDNYTYTTEFVGDQADEIELEVLRSTSRATVEKIYLFKREFNFLSKVIKPVREIVFALMRTEHPLVTAHLNRFVVDLQDLIIHTIESIDTYREVLSDYLSTYNSNVSNRMNEVMKVLTIFASIFIPLTFIAGIYGMNFDYLPELHFRYAYHVLWGVFLLISLLMLRYFKKQKWL